uniref:Uncharacterized protein n=1 Tax=Magallana gigas TaxID=29159 RepID=K1Q0P6_MAGGI
MESYFASSEDSSGYHSSEIQSSLIKRSQIHKQYRQPETNISYRQIQNHFLSGDAGLVSMKLPNYRQQIQNLYKSSSRENSGKSDRDFEKKQRGRNSLCLDEFEASFKMSQSMMTNGASEYCSQPELKVGTPGMSNQPMSSIEKVTKWILPPQEGGGIDRYTVKAKRKLSIQKVPESSAESFSRESELSSIVSSSCGNSTITTENLLHQNQMRNTEFDQESTELTVAHHLHSLLDCFLIKAALHLHHWQDFASPHPDLHPERHKTITEDRPWRSTHPAYRQRAMFNQYSKFQMLFHMKDLHQSKEVHKEH